MELFEVQTNSLKEEKVRYDSPLLLAYIRESHLKDYRGYRAEAHFHSDLEFIRVLQGSLSYSVNGIVYQINEGEGLFVNAKALHFGFSKKKRDCLFQVIVFSPLLLNVNLEIGKELILPVLERGVDHFSLLPDVPYQREVLKCMQDIFDSKSSLRNSNELQIVSLFYKMVYLLFPHVPIENESAKTHFLPIMQNMLGFIDESYSRNITLKDIAVAGNVSLRSANRFFSSYLHMTSNLGSEYLLKNDRSAVEAILHKAFKPEFLNRIDEIVYFNPLNKQTQLKIVAKMLDDLAKRLKEQYYSFSFSPALEKWILDMAYNPDFGARPIKRFIQDKIETAIAEKIVKGDVTTEKKYLADVDKDGVIVISSVK